MKLYNGIQNRNNNKKDIGEKGVPDKVNKNYIRCRTK